ncbi:MAG: VCBS repeat-containing protein [Lentisphaeria bacterium]|nr:VCBS repeat-containing protein [Lentisphaeria bacterium]
MMTRTACTLVFLVALCGARSSVAAGAAASVRLTVTSKLPCPRVPMDPTIDFGKLIRDAELPGVLDPNSISVVDLRTGKPILHATTSDFAYGDRGRVEWVVNDPAHTEYEIRFRTIDRRPPLESARLVPLVGVGDLLRYNAGESRRIALPFPSDLVDLTGDGKRDLAGCWNYFYGYKDEISGVVCYPRVGSGERFEFGDMIRLRHVSSADAADFKEFTSRSPYQDAAFADLNRDGLVDIAFRAWYSDGFSFFLNTGRRDAGGMPVFAAAGTVPAKTRAYNEFLHAVDLNRDGALDFVTRGKYHRNVNPEGWPVKLAEPVPLAAGTRPCFFDIDCDGWPDAVALAGDCFLDAGTRRIEWRKHLGTDPPTFGEPKLLDGFAEYGIVRLAAVPNGPRRGLLVLHDMYQAVSFYEQLPGKVPRFRSAGPARSLSAVMSLSDQATPFVCDWDGDGDRDLLVGGGYGWPRIVMNNGTDAQPAYAEPQRILSEGKPIRVTRNAVLGEPRHGHNMGYPFPVYVDWDMDGLPDLVLPNETNRILWFRNVGTRRAPEFGPQQQVVVDGYPDGPEHRRKSAELALKKTYPSEANRPFHWRQRATCVDLNGDGLVDLVTNDGQKGELTLFARYRADDGVLRLRKDGALKMVDGNTITVQTVLTPKKAEATRAGGMGFIVDWDGDGLLDVVYSCAGWVRDGSLFLLRNQGTKTEPVFARPKPLLCFGEPIFVTRHGPHPWVGDMDGDSKPDVLCYVEWSVYPFFSHAALTMTERPEYTLGKVVTDGRAPQ